jgi:hypothetical protein
LTAVEVASRRFAVCTIAGGLVGLLVGGVGGRLAMSLLAALNPSAHGKVSDDGFVMGQVTASGTLNLLMVSSFIGVFGGGIYLVLRGLMIGPRWFQVLSVSVGPAVVVGAMLVHRDGIDFVLLQPAWLAIALFVLIPALYGAALTLVAEPWLEPGSRVLNAPLPLLALILLLGWVPVFPAALTLAACWLLLQALRQVPVTAALVSHPVTHWVARAALTVVFTMSLAALLGDIRFLV